METKKQEKRSKEKFYKDLSFVNSPDARTVRILSEYYGPYRRFKQMKIKDTIVFFGSARIPSPENKNNSENQDTAQLVDYYKDARKLSYKLTKWSKGLKNSSHRFIITSGGGGGIMEAASRGAKEADGYSIGLNISLPFESAGNLYTTEKLDFVFHYFFMRKYWFLYLAKALVVFPGGFGTLDELMELLTLIQTGKIKKKLPIVVYDSKFWKNVINFDYMVKMGTISKEDLNLFHLSDSVNDAYKFLTKELTKTHLAGKNF